jgi:hypothetical protein
MQLDHVPVFGLHKAPTKRKLPLSNDTIRAMLKKADSEPSKWIASDFDVALETVNRIKRDYVLKNDVLYRRIEDGLQ